MNSPLELVLLPGLDGTGALFEPLVRALPATLIARVESYPCDEVLDYEALIARVQARVPTRGPWLLLGESFSGPIALEVAARSPPGLVGVVLVATFHRAPTSWLLGALARRSVPAMFSAPMPAFALKALLAGRDAPAALVADLQATMKKVSGRVLWSRLQAALRVDATDAARRVPVPVLYLAAQDEALMRRALPTELSRLIRAFSVETLPGPHLVLQRRPVESALAIFRFAQRCGDVLSKHASSRLSS